MEFGRVPEAMIEQIHFALPPDPVQNAGVLHRTEGAQGLYIGCPKWGAKAWLGKIYPERTREGDYRQAYVQHFNTVELNATHYKFYEPAVIRKWAAVAAGQDFLFCPKMNQEITHSGSLYEKQLLTHAFLEPLKELGTHLGPVFIQLSEYFGPERRKELLDYLAALPAAMQFFLELRHPGWFAEQESSFFELLEQMNIGMVITDTSGRRDCAHMRLTANRTMVRFVSNSLHPTDYERLDDWVQRLTQWYEQGLERCYFFIHMHEEAYAPELATYFGTQMQEATGLNVRLPKFIEKNTLF